MPNQPGTVRPYIYPTTHARLVQLQDKLTAARGGQRFTVDETLRWLLDLADRQEAGDRA